MSEDGKPVKIEEELKQLFPEAFGGVAPEGRSPLLRDILAWWQERRLVYDVSPALTEVLYEQAEEDDWNIPASMLQMLPEVFYLRTGVDALQGISHQEGIFLQREDEKGFSFLVVGEGGQEMFRTSFTAEDGAMPLRACLQAEGTTMEPFLERWMEVLLYLAAENGEMEEENEYFFLPGESLPQCVHHVRAGWETGKAIASMKADLQYCLREEEEAYRGERKLPRAHIRRSHWHMYRMGSRNRPLEERPLALRWLAPKLITGKRIWKTPPPEGKIVPFEKE